MFLTIILTMVYISVAAFAGVMTMLEQEDAGVDSAYYRTLGLLACATWPITFVLVAVAAQVHTQSLSIS